MSSSKKAPTQDTLEALWLSGAIGASAPSPKAVEAAVASAKLGGCRAVVPASSGIIGGGHAASAPATDAAGGSKSATAPPSTPALKPAGFLTGAAAEAAAELKSRPPPPKPTPAPAAPAADGAAAATPAEGAAAAATAGFGAKPAADGEKKPAAAAGFGASATGGDSKPATATAGFGSAGAAAAAGGGFGAKKPEAVAPAPAGGGFGKTPAADSGAAPAAAVGFGAAKPAEAAAPAADDANKKSPDAKPATAPLGFGQKAPSASPPPSKSRDRGADATAKKPAVKKPTMTAAQAADKALKGPSALSNFATGSDGSAVAGPRERIAVLAAVADSVQASERLRESWKPTDTSALIGMLLTQATRGADSTLAHDACVAIARNGLHRGIAAGKDTTNNNKGTAAENAKRAVEHYCVGVMDAFTDPSTSLAASALLALVVCPDATAARALTVDSLPAMGPCVTVRACALLLASALDADCSDANESSSKLSTLFDAGALAWGMSGFAGALAALPAAAIADILRSGCNGGNAHPSAVIAADAVGFVNAGTPAVFSRVTDDALRSLALVVTTVAHVLQPNAPSSTSGNDDDDDDDDDGRGSHRQDRSLCFEVGSTAESGVSVLVAALHAREGMGLREAAVAAAVPGLIWAMRFPCIAGGIAAHWTAIASAAAEGTSLAAGGVNASASMRHRIASTLPGGMATPPPMPGTPTQQHGQLNMSTATPNRSTHMTSLLPTTGRRRTPATGARSMNASSTFVNNANPVVESPSWLETPARRPGGGATRLHTSTATPMRPDEYLDSANAADPADGSTIQEALRILADMISDGDSALAFAATVFAVVEHADFEAGLPGRGAAVKAALLAVEPSLTTLQTVIQGTAGRAAVSASDALATVVALRALAAAAERFGSAQAGHALQWAGAEHGFCWVCPVCPSSIITATRSNGGSVATVLAAVNGSLGAISNDSPSSRHVHVALARVMRQAWARESAAAAATAGNGDSGDVAARVFAHDLPPWYAAMPDGLRLAFAAQLLSFVVVSTFGAAPAAAAEEAAAMATELVDAVGIDAEAVDDGQWVDVAQAAFNVLKVVRNIPASVSIDAAGVLLRLAEEHHDAVAAMLRRMPSPQLRADIETIATGLERCPDASPGLRCLAGLVDLIGVQLPPATVIAITAIAADASRTPFERAAAVLALPSTIAKNPAGGRAASKLRDTLLPKKDENHPTDVAVAALATSATLRVAFAEAQIAADGKPVPTASVEIATKVAGKIEGVAAAVFELLARAVSDEAAPRLRMRLTLGTEATDATPNACARSGLGLSVVHATAHLCGSMCAVAAYSTASAAVAKSALAIAQAGSEMLRAAWASKAWRQYPAVLCEVVSLAMSVHALCRAIREGRPSAGSSSMLGSGVEAAGSVDVCSATVVPRAELLAYDLAAVRSLADGDEEFFLFALDTAADLLLPAPGVSDGDDDNDNKKKNASVISRTALTFASAADTEKGRLALRRTLLHMALVEVPLSMYVHDDPFINFASLCVQRVAPHDVAHTAKHRHCTHAVGTAAPATHHHSQHHHQDAMSASMRGASGSGFGALSTADDGHRAAVTGRDVLNASAITCFIEGDGEAHFSEWTEVATKALTAFFELAASHVDDWQEDATATAVEVVCSLLQKGLVDQSRPGWREALGTLLAFTDPGTAPSARILRRTGRVAQLPWHRVWVFTLRILQALIVALSGPENDAEYRNAVVSHIVTPFIGSRRVQAVVQSPIAGVARIAAVESAASAASPPPHQGPPAVTTPWDVVEGELVTDIAALLANMPCRDPSARVRAGLRDAAVRGFVDVQTRRLDSLRFALRSCRVASAEEQHQEDSAAKKDTTATNASAPGSPQTLTRDKSSNSFAKANNNNNTSGNNKDGGSKDTTDLSPRRNKPTRDASGDAVGDSGVPLHHLLLTTRRNIVRLLCATLPNGPVMANPSAFQDHGQRQQHQQRPSAAFLTPAEVVDFIRSCLRVLSKQQRANESHDSTGSVGGDHESSAFTPLSRPADAHSATARSILGGTVADSTIGQEVIDVVGDSVQHAVILFCTDAERHGVTTALTRVPVQALTEAADEVGRMLQRTRRDAGEYQGFIDCAEGLLRSYGKRFADEPTASASPRRR